MKITSLLLIGTGLLLFQKLNFQSNQKFPNEVKHLLTITSLHKDTLFDAYDFSVNSQGNIYITDQIENCIKVFDKNGKLINKFGKQGKGNSEFNTIGEIAVSPNFIAVADYTSSRIQIFSIDFKYIRTIYAQGVVFDLAFDSEECLWVAANTGKKNKSLFQYAKESNRILQIIPLKYSSGIPFKDFFSLAISKDGYIIVAYRVINKIEIWNRSGTFVRDFKIPGLKDEADYKKISTGLFSSTKVPEGLIVKNCSVDSMCNIFLIGAHYSEKPFQDIYVMNIDGELINKITMPDKIWKIIGIDKNNLYLIVEKRNMIKKYLLK
ncbi:MAG: cell surface protein [Ignavibacteriae bacterium]|nr:MAG: cell surface protein [Ignavibacteriota bacterium]